MLVSTLALFYLFFSATSQMVLGNEAMVLSQLVDSQLAGKNGLSGCQVLEKGEESLLTRAWLTNHSQRTIDIQYFIWSTDNIGILAAEFLLRAADRGVRVRVIVDDLLIDAPDEYMLALDAHPEIEVKVYNPKHSVGVPKSKRLYHLVTDFHSFNQRMHDKTMIVDGAVVITGGRNMADEYFDYDQTYNFRDRDILLVGPVVEQVEKNFSSFWESSLSVSVKTLLQPEDTLSKEKIQKIYKDLHVYATNPDNFADNVRKALAEFPEKFPVFLKSIVWDNIEFIHDIPGKNEERSFSGGSNTTFKLVSLIERAKERIVIQSPYLVLPEGGLELFAKMVDKGVDVQIVTNSLAATDNLYAFSGYKKQRKAILDAGIKVFEFKPRPEIQKKLINRLTALGKSVPIFAIHAKSMVVDGTTLFVGTFNLDPRSVHLNTEVGVLINNRQLASQVEQAIQADMALSNSWLAGRDKPDRYAPFVKRFKIWFWGLFPLDPLL